MALKKAEEHVEQVLEAWSLGGAVTGAARYGEGHINDTFAVDVDGERWFILQRVNSFVFKDPRALMENYVAVTQYLRGEIEKAGGNPDRECLTVVHTRQGAPYHVDEEGQLWRLLLFVDAVSYQKAETPELFYESAKAFGRFARLLEGFEASRLHETIPRFHDTPNRFANFQKALAADALGRAKDCRPEIDFVLARQEDCGVLTSLLASGGLPLRVTHNDTKLNNVLIDPATQKAVCVIDLDTVMPGLMLNDFGDSIRFGASTAAEDEPDLSKVHFSLPLYKTYTQGFLEAAGAAMTPKEREMLPWGARLMTLECGIRFLTDYLEGDIYFKIHRPGHNLDRCRTQFRLVEEMEQNWRDMQIEA